MENQPGNAGKQNSSDNDTLDQSSKFAQGRAISDMVKNKDKGNDDAAYADDEVGLPEEDQRTEGEKQAESKPEDFDSFNLDAIDEQNKSNSEEE